MALETELALYRRELPALLKDHEGQYVLIKGEKIDSFWQSEEEATDAGFDRFGPVPFFVRQVQAKEPTVALVAHPVNPVASAHPCRP